MNCNQNEEIIIEVEINMCLTVQNISTISAKHFLGARVEPKLSRFFWEYPNYRSIHGKIHNQGYR